MKTKVDVFKFFKLCFVAAIIIAFYIIHLNRQNKATTIAALPKAIIQLKP